MNLDLLKRISAEIFTANTTDKPTTTICHPDSPLCHSEFSICHSERSPAHHSESPLYHSESHFCYYKSLFCHSERSEENKRSAVSTRQSRWTSQKINKQIESAPQQTPHKLTIRTISRVGENLIRLDLKESLDSIESIAPNITPNTLNIESLITNTTPSTKQSTATIVIPAQVGISEIAKKSQTITQDLIESKPIESPTALQDSNKPATKESIFFDLTKSKSLVFIAPRESFGIRTFSAPFDKSLSLLNSAQILSSQIDGQNRILRLFLRTSGSYKATHYTLQLEFTGRNTNAILLDQKNIIQAALHFVPAHFSRPILLGHTLPPLPQPTHRTAPNTAQDSIEFKNIESTAPNTKQSTIIESKFIESATLCHSESPFCHSDSPFCHSERSPARHSERSEENKRSAVSTRRSRWTSQKINKQIESAAILDSSLRASHSALNDKMASAKNSALNDKTKVSVKTSAPQSAHTPLLPLLRELYRARLHENLHSAQNALNAKIQAKLNSLKAQITALKSEKDLLFQAQTNQTYAELLIAYMHEISDFRGAEITLNLNSTPFLDSNKSAQNIKQTITPTTNAAQNSIESKPIKFTTPSIESTTQDSNKQNLITIPLPYNAPSPAAQSYFKAAKKLRAKAANIHRECENLNERIDFYLRLFNAAQNAQNLATLEILRSNFAKNRHRTAQDSIKFKNIESIAPSTKQSTTTIKSKSIESAAILDSSLRFSAKNSALNDKKITRHSESLFCHSERSEESLTRIPFCHSDSPLCHPESPLCHSERSEESHAKTHYQIERSEENKRSAVSTRRSRWTSQRIKLKEESQKINKQIESITLNTTRDSNKFPTKAQIESFFIDSYKISIGRSEKANLALLHSARADDLWLHIRALPSSHLIIHCGRTKPPKEVISQAAELLVSLCGSRGGRYEIDFTRRKFVKLTGRGANVIYDKYETISPAQN